MGRGRDALARGLAAAHGARPAGLARTRGVVGGCGGGRSAAARHGLTAALKIGAQRLGGAVHGLNVKVAENLDADLMASRINAVLPKQPETTARSCPRLRCLVPRS